MASKTVAGRDRRPARDQEKSSGVGRRFVTTKAAADYLGVVDRTIRKMIAEGRLTGYRNGRILRVDMNEVEACLRPFGGAA